VGIYIGEAVHKGTAYPGEHDAIISQDLWDRVHAIMDESPRARAANTRAQTPALLKGLLFSASGSAMTPTHTKKGSKLYRYYISMDVLRNRVGETDPGPHRLPAGMIEEAVVGEIRALLRTPDIAAQTLLALKRENVAIDEAEVLSAITGFDDLWQGLFPAEQARILQLLVHRATITEAGLVVDLRTDGITGLIREMLTPKSKETA